MTARLSHQPIAGTPNYLFVKPAAFQLWFSRELPVMFPYTPILCYIARKKWRLALLIAFDSSLVYFGLVYLWTGLIIVINRCDVENYYRSRWSMAVAAFIYAVIVSSSTAFMSPRCIIFKKSALALCGTSQATIIIFYYLNPLLPTITAVVVARLLKRFIPRVYAVLTGGR